MLIDIIYFVCRGGNEDKCVHNQSDLVQQLNQVLSGKNMIFSKNSIQVSKVVGQGNHNVYLCNNIIIIYLSQ